MSPHGLQLTALFREGCGRAIIDASTRPDRRSAALKDIPGGRQERSALMERGRARRGQLSGEAVSARV